MHLDLKWAIVCCMNANFFNIGTEEVKIISFSQSVGSSHSKFSALSFIHGPGAVAQSEASSLGMQAAPSLIPTSSTFFRGDLVMKKFLRPFSLFR